MTPAEKDIAIIEKYLRQSLSAEDQIYFNARLADAEFSKELEYQRDLQLAFKAAGRDAQKQKLQELEKELVSDSAVKSGPKNSWQIWIILLLGIIGLAALFYFLSAKKSPTEEQLYAQYAQAYPNVITAIQRDTASQNLQNNPYQLYEQRNYAQAINEFTELPESSADSEFYLSLSYLFNSEFSKSKAILEEIDRSTSHRFHQPAQWYLALILLHEQRYSECRIVLNKIKQTPDHPFSIKAGQLLEELNEY